ncbi:MAG TPA: hypothetical protein PL045_07705 [Chitinophagaceae bacterium]|nr:hypothetical protein [Chitinophagaceae bacterium]
MIDNILALLQKIMPALHTGALLAFIAKAAIVSRSKGFNLTAIMLSLFRIYSQREVSMSNKSARITYMRINNYLNYYLYFWVFAWIIMLLVFQSPY